MRATPEERFWAKVDFNGPTMPGMDTPCHVWTASVNYNRNGDPYPRFCWDGKTQGGHRVAVLLGTGVPVPSNKQVDHMCHNTLCVNHKHLDVVTQKQNKENPKGAYRNSKSGVRGVVRRKSGWEVTVRHCKKTYYGGTFDDLDEAAAAVAALRNELFTHNRMDRAVPPVPPALDGTTGTTEVA